MLFSLKVHNWHLYVVPQILCSLQGTVCKIFSYVFQDEKKQLKEEGAKDKDLLQKYSLNIDLVKEHTDDIKMAQLMKLNVVQCKY